MTDRITAGGLRVAKPVYELIRDRVSPGTGIAPEDFWRSLEQIHRELGPTNKELLAERDRLQTQIDAWHREHKGRPQDREAYRAFLKDIGYVLPEGEDFEVATTNVDSEVAQVGGPQLVVPVSNAGYALNAANARWGSLYDALYGTDAIGEEDGAQRGTGYNPAWLIGLQAID